MSISFNYPAMLERDEDGSYVVTFPDFGWGATAGETRETALIEAQDLLRELLRTTIREGEPIPVPSRASKHRPLVSAPVSIALKAALYDATQESGISQRQLAHDLNVTENEIRRMLNPDHATKTSTLDGALRQLGKRISVTIS